MISAVLLVLFLGAECLSKAALEVSCQSSRQFQFNMAFLNWARSKKGSFSPFPNEIFPVMGPIWLFKVKC